MKETNLRIGWDHNSNCDNVSILVRVIQMFNDGNGEHMDQQSVYKYPNDTSCHIMYSSMHEHYTHIISTSKYKFNSIININNGMIIFGSIYSRRERVMLNGIDIDDDKSNGSVATLTPSNVVFHLICLDRDEHIGITSVNNIMHRLTNTMSRCTDDVVGVDNNDNNNISIVDTNYNGTRSAKLLPSSEYGEHITSVDTNHTPINKILLMVIPCTVISTTMIRRTAQE